MAVAAAAAAPAPVPVEVTVIPERAFLTLGVEKEDGMTVTVRATGPDAAALAPSRSFASTGVLDPLQPTGTPGEFTARYQVPTSRFPQVAVLVVELGGSGGRRVRGMGRILLHAATAIPLRSSAGASVTVTVADKTFGPVPADGQGAVKIPIVVPPGVRSGLARAVDRDGNAKETPVDLQPAPFGRVLIVPPPSIEVGSFAEVSVYAVEPTGDPAPDRAVSLRSAQALAHPLGGGIPGEARFLVEAPRRLAGGPLLLTATAAGKPASHTDVALPLTPGKPDRLFIKPSSKRLVVGSGTRTTITISAADRFGNPTPAVGILATVDGQPAPMAFLPTGAARFDLAAPERYGGRDDVKVEASLGSARAAERVHLVGAVAARMMVEISPRRLIADGRRGTEVRARVSDANGTPTAAPSLTWEASGGHFGPTSTPREGIYVVKFVPSRARHQHPQPLTVVAGPQLRTTVTIEVDPPQDWLRITPRVGFVTNFGSLTGPSAFLEALTRVPTLPQAFSLGLALGYLRNDFSGSMTPGGGEAPSHLRIDQFPLLLVSRTRLPLRLGAEISVGAGLGVSLATTKISSTQGAERLMVSGVGRTLAAEIGADAAFALAPGQAVVGLRYLWIDFGRTGQGDEIRGNTAGLVADLGYRLGW
jgi:hypothetical protein